MTEKDHAVPTDAVMAGAVAAVLLVLALWMADVAYTPPHPPGRDC